MSSYSVVTNLRTTLAQSMTSSQSSCNLTSVTVQGHALEQADYGEMIYIVLNPGASNMEVVRASTNVGTAFTLDKRGLAWYGEGDTELPAYKFAHNAGEPVIVSNVKNVYEQLVDKWSDETITGIKDFALSPLVPTPLSSELNAAASVEYVNETTTAGAPDASTTVKGIVGIATDTKAESGDDSTVNGALPVILPSQLLDSKDNQVTTDYTYGATISVGDAVFLDIVDGKWKLADATSTATVQSFVGFALDAGVNNDTGKRVQLGGVVTGLSGLTPGYQYIQDTPGTIGATPGTVRKAVGRAPNATSLVMLDTFSVARLTGANANATTANFNEAMDFFASGDQGLTVYIEAGVNLSEGDIVSLQSDGKVYRTSPLLFSTQNTGAEVEASVNAAGMALYSTSNPLIKCAIYGKGTNTGSCARITFDADRINYASDQVTALTITASHVLSRTLQLSDSLLVFSARTGGGTGTGEVSAINALTTTPSQGTPVTLGTNDGDGVLGRYSDTIFLAFSGGSAPGTGNLETEKGSVSGNTITLSGIATLLVSANATTAAACCRIGATEKFLFTYRDSDANTHNMLVATWNVSTGAWTDVGTPVTIATNFSGPGYLVPIDDTKCLYGWTNSTTTYIAFITVSGNTPSIGTASSTSQRRFDGERNSITELGRYTYLINWDNTSTSRPQAGLLTTNQEYTTLSILDNVAISSAGDDEGAGCYIRENGIAFIYDDGTNVDVKTIDLTTNYSSLVGIVSEDVTQGVNAKVTYIGPSDTQNGLSIGTLHYTGIGGELTSDSTGTTLVGPAITATKILKT